MAQKVSEHLKKPVPDLSRTITKIMNVVWVEPEVKKQNKKLRTITYTVYNYTTQPRSIRLHAQIPKEAVNLSLFSGDYFLDMNDEGKANWEIKDLAPSTSTKVSFELTGEMADTFDADDIYFSGLNPVIVMGAEMLPGDWGIKGLDIVQTSEDDLVSEDDEDSQEVEDLDDE